MAMWYFSSVLVFGLMTSPWLNWGVGAVIVYELYGKTPSTNRSVACGVCEARNGQLAIRPAVDDWEILFGNWSHMDTTEFWVDLTKTTSGNWIWGDGLEMNMTHITSLPMTPAYNVTYAASNCALWNMAEPFYMPADCSVTANIICEVTAPSTTPECEMKEQAGMKFRDNTALPPFTTTSLGECVDACPTTSECWAVEWNEATNDCRKLMSPTTDSRPAVPDLDPDGDYIVAGRICIRYIEMPPEDSEFICNCGAIELPETEEEKKKFVEEYKEEVKKELIVPTDTLSSTVRKKESAPDERKSSTSMGFLGITMMVVVFGGLVLLDLTSLISHIKNATDNLKNAIGKSDEESSEA